MMQVLCTAITLMLAADTPGGGSISMETLSGYDAREATVLLFVNTTCPIANRYAPEMNRIHRDFEEEGVALYRVYSNHTVTEEDIDSHTREFSLAMPYFHDADYALAQRVGAKVTPEAVVVDSEGEVRYCGRIDNLFYALGKTRSEVTKHDLRDAIKAVLAGNEVSLKETKAYGCYIDPPEPFRKDNTVVEEIAE